MIGLDTNILVRYLVQDDPGQSKLATNFIEKCSEENPAFISGIVLCELIWVLETAYDYPKKNIADVLEKILKTRQFKIHHPETLWQALRDYRHETIDFSDSYIAHLNFVNECDYTITFDKKAARLKYFKLLNNVLN